jgi:aminopeptidase N
VISVRHIDLELRALFEERTLEGVATLQLLRNPLYPSVPLILDTHDLKIRRVEAGSPSGSFEPVDYEIGPSDAILGAPLTIELPSDASHVRIAYSTSPNATALQWLAPAQTAGKKHPFLFTQSQSIHARSWIPLQDTPSVRLTYSAQVKTPPGLIAVMSAENNPSAARGSSHEFRMGRPIPPYLIALAIGDLEFAPTGPRTGVFAEPPVIAAAAFEFADAEKMLEVTEQLYGPYLWGRFDILVLPPSFPYGGMENPALIFVTPTLIAGDRSSVSLIAHELSHAWSGNLVTNATWRDFWLNEGFTTYIERRIQERLYGKRRAEIEEVLAEQRLDDELKRLAPCDQVLHINLDGRDPDSGVTQVPYIKGALFLKSLEEAFGRERFDEYLRAYFDHFAFKSVTTEEALRFLREKLLNRHPALARAVPVEEWVYEPGLPGSAPRTVSPALNKIRKEVGEWQNHKLGLHQLDSSQWSAKEWLYFLRSLSLDLDLARMSELDEAFHFTRATNTEILQQWLLMAVCCRYTPAYFRLEEFLMAVGRLIFIKPLYEALVKTEDGKRLAKAIYSRARANYHPLSQAAVEKIVGSPDVKSA